MGAAQSPGQADGEVGVGLEAPLGWAWGRAGQGVSRLYYTVKNTAHWFCGHEVFTKGVGKVPTGNSRPRRNIRWWRHWERGGFSDGPE